MDAENNNRVDAQKPPFMRITHLFYKLMLTSHHLMIIIHLSERVEKPQFDENYTPFLQSWCWEATIWWELYTFLKKLRSHNLMRITHFTLYTLQGWCSEATIILDLHTFLKELVLKKHYLIRIFHTLRKISTSLWEQMIENLLIRVIITLRFFLFQPIFVVINWAG